MKVRQILFRRYDDAQLVASGIRAIAGFDEYKVDYGSIPSGMGMSFDQSYVMTDAPMSVVKKAAKMHNVDIPLQRRVGTIRRRNPSLPESFARAVQLVTYEEGKFLAGHVAGMSRADKDAIDAYLVAVKHPLAMQAGTQEGRIIALAHEESGESRRNPDPAHKKMTLAQAREVARSYQTTLRKNVHGEFVVTPLWDRREESRYYTSDLDDALATARDMHERFTSSTRRPVMALRQQRYVKNARSRRQAKRNASAYVKNPKRPPRGGKLRFLSDVGKTAAERITIVREGGYVHQVKYEDVNDDRAYVHDFDDLSAFMYLVETVWGRGVLIVPADDKPLWENS